MASNLGKGRAYDKSNIRIYDKRYYVREGEESHRSLLREGPVLFGHAELGDKDPSPHNNLSYHNKTASIAFSNRILLIYSHQKKRRKRRVETETSIKLFRD